MPISEARRFLNEELLPRWAKQFEPGQVVYDIGVSKWDYRKHFDCEYITVDRDAKRIPDIILDVGNWLDGDLPTPQASGILLNGVFEQSDDPSGLMRSVINSLYPNGNLLAGLISIDAPWKSDRDKWRVTRAGALAYCKGFHIDEFCELPGYFFVLGTKE